MTQEQVRKQEVRQRGTPQYHHLRAAQFHELASLHHKEAARHLVSGNERAAIHHAQLASDHMANALEESEEASRQTPRLYSV